MSRETHVTLSGKTYTSISHLLADTTNPDTDFFETLDYESEESCEFYDLILGFMHNPDAFRGLPPISSRERVAYTVSGGQTVSLQSISMNYLNRCLQVFCKPRFRSARLFALLHLSGIQVPDQVMCLASGFTTFMDDRGIKSNWLKLLLDIGHRVVRNGHIIKDNFGNSILSTVSAASCKYLFQALQAEGCFTLEIKERDLARFKDYPQLKGYLDKFTFSIEK